MWGRIPRAPEMPAINPIELRDIKLTLAMKNIEQPSLQVPNQTKLSTTLVLRIRDEMRPGLGTKSFLVLE